MSGNQRAQGVLYALGADATFIGLSGLIAATPSLGALSIGSLRILGALPLLAGLLAVRSPAEAKTLLRLGWRDWGLSGFTAALLGANVWLFAAAPLWGQADALAQGYLFLPVCLVALDILRGVKLGGLALFGVLLACGGVFHTFFATGRVAPVTLFIGLSMALYFDLHKRRALSLLQRVVSDFSIIAPFCVFALVLEGKSAVIMQQWPTAIALGALTAAAYIFYLGASKTLDHAIFGILTLVEPIGLAAIACVAYHQSVSPWDLGLMSAGALLVSIPGRWLTTVPQYPDRFLRYVLARKAKQIIENKFSVDVKNIASKR